MQYDEQEYKDAKEAAKTAWVRFCNGLKIDGKERQLIMRYVYSAAPFIRHLEQQIYNLEHVLDTPHLLAVYLKTDCKHYFPDECRCKCHNNGIIMHDHACCEKCLKCGFKTPCSCERCREKSEHEP